VGANIALGGKEGLFGPALENVSILQKRAGIREWRKNKSNYQNAAFE